MSLSHTAITEANNAYAGTAVTKSITVAVDDTILIWAVLETDGSSPSVSCSGGGLTWYPGAPDPEASGPFSGVRMFIARATSATTFTVTVTPSAGGNTYLGLGIQGFVISGARLTPLASVAVEDHTSTTQNISPAFTTAYANSRLYVCAFDTNYAGALTSSDLTLTQFTYGPTAAVGWKAVASAGATTFNLVAAASPAAWLYMAVEIAVDPPPASYNPGFIAFL